jgi:hypothetical protein
MVGLENPNRWSCRERGEGREKREKKSSDY